MDLKEPDYEFYPVHDCWFNIAYDLLTLANDCLTDTPFGNPSEMYVDTGEPEFDCCDFLAVYPHTIRPIQYRKGVFPEENFQQQEKCDSIYWVPRFELTLGRPCRPVIDARSKSQPRPASPLKKSEFSRAIYADAQSLAYCTTDKINAGYKLGGVEFEPQEVFPQQVYMDPFGPCMRIRFRIMFDVNCGCNPDQGGYDDPDWVDRSVSIGPLGKVLPPLKLVRGKL